FGRPGPRANPERGGDATQALTVQRITAIPGLPRSPRHRSCKGKRQPTSTRAVFLAWHQNPPTVPPGRVRERRTPMETTINKKPENHLPEEGWANQLARACQLATSASLFPALAVLQHARLLSADVAAVGEVAAAQRGCYWEGVRTFFRVETPATP